MAVRLVVGVALAAALGVGYFWLHAGDLLTQRVQQELTALAPGWGIELEGVQLRGQQALVHGIVLRPGEGREQLLAVPELVVTLDRDALAQWQTVQVEHVRLIGPTLRLIRLPDGTLNTSHLPPLPPTTGQSPHIAIERATVLLQNVDAAGQTRSTVRLQDIDLTLTPSAAQRYRIVGQSRWEDFGQIAVQAAVDIPRRSGVVDLTGQSLQVDDTLIRTLTEWHPPLERKLASMMPATQPVQVAAADELRFDGVTLPPAAPADPTKLGLTAVADVRLKASVRPDQPPDWSGHLDLRRGTLRSPLFPLPLHDLTASIDTSPEGVEIGSFKAANGSARLSVSGTLRPSPTGLKQQIDLTAEDLSVSGPLRAYLTPSLAKLHQILQPTGTVAVSARLDNTGAQPSLVQLRSLTVRDGTAVPTVFPYPVTDVRGEIVPDGDGDGTLNVELSGRAGGREVRCTGQVFAPGPGAGFALAIEGADIPIDRTLREAFRTERLKTVGATIDALNLRGRGDGRVTLSRQVAAGSAKQPVRVGVDVQVREADLLYDKFPYPLARVSGRIRCSPSEPVWTFEQLQGEGRSGARVTAAGVFDRRTKPGRLQMRFDATDAPIDGDLRHATITAAPTMAAAWRELNPQGGQVSAGGIRIDWTPGQPVRLDLPDLRVRDAGVELASLPFRWSDVDVEAARVGDRVLLRRVTARHGQTELTIDGRNEAGQVQDDLAYVEHRPNGFQVHLQNVHVRDAVADNELLRALPESLRTTVATLRPEGPLDLHFALHLASDRERPVRFDYAGDILLKGNTLSAGVDVENARGRIRINELRGDGQTVRLRDGRIQLDSAEILGFKLTDLDGPLELTGNQLIVGSERVVMQKPGEPPLPIGARDRLTASFYGGTVGFDAIAILRGARNELQYQARVTVDEARLERWAAENAVGERLSGEVRGEVRMYGFGDDPAKIEARDGFIQIREARLYTLPPIAKIFTTLSQPDDTAFRYAYGGFDIQNGRLLFKRVELVGDSIMLGGDGMLSFLPAENGAIGFNLYSKTPNATPIIGKLLEMGTAGWMQVQVRGSVTNPVVTSSYGPPLIGAMRGFRDRVEAGGGRLAPPAPVRSIARPAPRRSAGPARAAGR